MTSGTATGIVRATSRQETPGFFDSDDGPLFGILTRPTSDPLGVGLAVLPGGGRPLATNRNGFSVRLTREAASQGFHGLRFDYHGCGESAGTVTRFRLHDPFPGDLRAALSWGRSQGVDRFALMGSCFGARAALWVAAEDPGVVGAVLVAMPVRDLERGERISTRLARDRGVLEYMRKGLRPQTLRGVFDGDRRRAYGRLVRAKWQAMTGRRRATAEYTDRYELSRIAMRQLETVLERRMPILFVFGQDDDLRDDFERAQRGPLGELLKRAGDLVQVAVVPGHVHGFVGLDVQEGVARVALEWMGRRWTSP